MHKLVKNFMEQFNITQKQAEFLVVIARNGFATVKILYILNLLEGVKGIQNAYTRVAQLKKRGLVRFVDTSLSDAAYIIVPTEKVKRAAKLIKYNVPRLPASSVQLRHNAIAIAVVLMEIGMKGLDGYLTTNQVNKFKDMKKWKSKTPDAVLIDAKRNMGYLVEIELNIKKASKYIEVMKNIHIENEVAVLRGGWGSILYYVDTLAKKRKLERRLEEMKRHHKNEVVEAAQNVVVFLLSDVLEKFNERVGGDLVLKMFTPVL